MMNSTLEMKTDVMPNGASRKTAQASEEDHRYVWAVCGAGIGLIGGVLAPFFGAVFTIISWLEGSGLHAPTFQQAGTICFFLTIPLLIFGGVCLDALEKRGWKIG